MRSVAPRAFHIAIGAAQPDFFSVRTRFAGSGGDIGTLRGVGGEGESDELVVSLGDFSCDGGGFGWA